MQITENKILDILFKVALTLGLIGLTFYLLQELIYTFEPELYLIFIAIANILGILAIITTIVWLFVKQFDMILMNLAILLGLAYVFFYLFSHFFAPDYIPGGFGLSFLEKYYSIELNFIGLIVLCLLSLGLIVIFSIRFTKRDQFAIYEKFPIVLWFIIIGIFDFASNYYFRNEEAFDFPPTLDLGISFLPKNFELFFAFFAAILLIMSFFIGVNKKILDLLSLLLLNSVFITAAILTTSSIGFSMTDISYIITILGHAFIILGAVSLLICTVIVLQVKYPKSLATRSRN